MVTFLNPPLQERRETPRVRCQNPVEYRIFCPCQFQNNFMCNISKKGISLLIDQWVPKGIPVTFQAKLAKNLPAIFGKGKTIWSMQESYCDKYRVGIEITELNNESISRLSEFLQKEEQPENQS